MTWAMLLVYVFELKVYFSNSKKKKLASFFQFLKFFRTLKANKVKELKVIGFAASFLSV